MLDRSGNWVESVPAGLGRMATASEVQKETLLITGGAGFLGTHLAEHFSSRFHVRLFDNFSRNALKFVPHLFDSSDFEIIKGDILNTEEVEAAVRGSTAVLHCAAIAGVSNYYNRPLDTLRVNIIGTFNLLDAVVAAGVKRVIYFSTSEIYGPNAAEASELMPPTSGPVSDRRWVYGVGKLAGEHLTLRYGEAHGINVTVVRPFNIYGPRQIGEGAISNFSRKLVRGEPLEIQGDGSEVRAWCHIDDLTTAVDLALHNQESFGKTLNIGNPNARLTTLQLARKMIELYGRGEWRIVPHPHVPISVRSPDITLAQSLLGYSPQVDLDHGLTATIDWFRREQP